MILYQYSWYLIIGIKVIKGKANPNSSHEVDGISGATVTSKGLEVFLLDDLKKYEPFFKKLRNNQTYIPYFFQCIDLLENYNTQYDINYIVYTNNNSDNTNYYDYTGNNNDDKNNDNSPHRGNRGTGRVRS